MKVKIYFSKYFLGVFHEELRLAGIVEFLWKTFGFLLGACMAWNFQWWQVLLFIIWLILEIKTEEGKRGNEGQKVVC